MRERIENKQELKIRRNDIRENYEDIEQDKYYEPGKNIRKCNHSVGTPLIRVEPTYLSNSTETPIVWVESEMNLIR